MINKSKSPSSWITNPTDWLSDLDIDRVEHNFVKLFPDYYYVGCVTIDFDLNINFKDFFFLHYYLLFRYKNFKYTIFIFK